MYLSKDNQKSHWNITEEWRGRKRESHLLQMLTNVRKLGIELPIDHDIGFLEVHVSGAFPLRLISSLGQVPHATLDAVFHFEVRIDYPHVLSTVRIVISTMESARER